MAVISGGDFRVSTYRDGKLAAGSDAQRDVLTILTLGQQASRVELPVSNSVTAPPEVMALSPDGRFVYVVERDISDPTHPRTVSTVNAGPMPESVRVSPDGRLLLVAANSADDTMVQIIRSDGGRLGSPQTFRLTELGLQRVPGKPRGGINASFADWHPSGRFVSVNLNTHHEVVFFEVGPGADGEPTLSPWGGARQGRARPVRRPLHARRRSLRVG